MTSYWRDLEIGEEIKPGDRMCTKGKWLFLDEGSILFPTYIKGVNPVQRLVKIVEDDDVYIK